MAEELLPHVIELTGADRRVADRERVAVRVAKADLARAIRLAQSGGGGDQAAMPQPSPVVL